MVAVVGVGLGFSRRTKVSKGVGEIVVFPWGMNQVRLGAFTPASAVAAFPGNRYMARSTIIGRSLSTRDENAALGKTWFTKTLVRESGGRERAWVAGGLPPSRRQEVVALAGSPLGVCGHRQVLEGLQVRAGAQRPLSVRGGVA